MSKLSIGDDVMIHPISTLKFAKKWGRIRQINTDDSLPIKIQFIGSKTLYGFSENELLTKEDVARWNSKSAHYCHKCGKDITGRYSSLCEQCAFPLPEGE